MEEQRKKKEEKEEEEVVVHEVVIVGGGIAGLSTALALKKVGIKSLVLERSHELRAIGTVLHVFENAWRALEALGVADKLDRAYNDFQTEMAHVSNITNGTTRDLISFDTSKASATRMRPIHRKFLLETLAEELPTDAIRFSSKLVNIKSQVQNDSSSLAVLHMEDGSILKTKVLIGCEGVHSVVAQWLGLTAPISSGRSAVRGVGLFPESHGFKREHQKFLAPGIKGGFVPISSTEIYWYLIKTSTPQEQEIGSDPEAIIKRVLKTVQDFPPEYKEVVRRCDLSTVTFATVLFRVPWDILLGPVCRGCVTVAGDAFHPMTPDMAQGGCAALEDAVVFARNMANFRNHAEQGIKKYVEERRWRAATLVAWSYVSGLVNQCRPGVVGWVLDRVRGFIFHWLHHSKYGSLNYDCGVLPPSCVRKG